MMAFSKSQQRKYWFHTLTHDGRFECPKEAVMDFKSAFTKKYVIKEYREPYSIYDVYPKPDLSPNQARRDPRNGHMTQIVIGCF